MRRGRRTAALAIGVAVTLGSISVAGCSGLEPSDPVDLPPPAPAAIHDSWPGCLKLGAFDEFEASPPDLGRGAVPTGFVTTTVVVCTVVDVTAAFPAPDAPMPDTGYERRGDQPADVQAVLDYLAMPSQQFDDSGSTACDLPAQVLPWLFLLDADGRWIQPALPLDSCGHSRPPAHSGPLPYLAMQPTNVPVCRVEVTGQEWRCVPL